MKFLLLLMIAAACAHTPPSKLETTASLMTTARIGEGKANFTLAASALAPTLVLLGPAEDFRGEITVLDGKVHISKFVDGKVITSHESEVRTPFNVRANCLHWSKTPALNGLEDLRALEAALPKEKIFFFKGELKARKTLHHIVTGVSTPGQHPSQKKFTAENVSFRVLGVHSPKHQRVFTHHDRTTHLHVIDQAGHTYHLDEAEGVELTEIEVCQLTEA